jgi:adenosylcobinamide-phosphate synthase
MIAALEPHAVILLAAALADVLVGDPVYPFHPVRLIGATLALGERALRSAGADGYAGGIALFLLLASVWSGGLGALVAVAYATAPWLGWIGEGFLVYSFLALGDLLKHSWRIEADVSRGDLDGARRGVGALVGRDTDRLDAAGCRRAVVESVSENLTDGVTSALFWYTVAGLPGLALFKVVSTMDSMVGYKTPRYRRFGWCGARLDDLMNFVPARLTWALIAGLAAIVPGYCGRKAWHVGLAQHAELPGPNSGWSETAMAGALGRRLVGPLTRDGALVTDVWIGDPADRPLESAADFARAMHLALLAGLVSAAVAAALAWLIR